METPRCDKEYFAFAIPGVVPAGTGAFPGSRPEPPVWKVYEPGWDHLSVPIMLTSHRLLQQYWHDERYDIVQVRVWYTDRGAPDDRSVAEGPDIRLEPYYLNIRTPAGEKPVPYHRILLITYRGVVVFVNQKVRGLEEIIAGNARDICGCDENGPAESSIRPSGNLT